LIAPALKISIVRVARMPMEASLKITELICSRDKRNRTRVLLVSTPSLRNLISGVGLPETLLKVSGATA
jgi:hypothetical protein